MTPASPEVFQLHHVGIVTRDFEASLRFYGRLGLRQHPTKPNWLLAGQRGAVHLLEMGAATESPAPPSPRHLALHVERLESVRDVLLSAGLVPYQLSLDWQRREVGADDDLDWGLGTMFVDDPDGNAVEFVQAGRGIFAQHTREDM